MSTGSVDVSAALVCGVDDLQCWCLVLVQKKMWSVTGYRSLISLLVILLPSLAREELARHRALGTISRVSYSDSGYDGHHYGSRPRRVVIRRKVIARPRSSHRTNTVLVPAERPLAPVPSQSLHPVAGFEGSYVAVSGVPGRGSVHVVETVPALGRDSVTVVNGVAVRSRGGHNTAVVPLAAPPPVAHPVVSQPPVVRVQPVAPVQVPVAPVQVPVAPVQVPVAPAQPAPRPVLNGDRLPLPKCSYINTDFPGDNIYLDEDGDGDADDDQPGINAGSARACKARCRLEERCSFWTYREGFARDTLTKDCFLKEGTPGLPVPREAVPRLGFVSGTQDNNCVCITSEDEEDEVCPIKEPRGLVYPWRSTDEEENDLERGLPPLGWTRGVYGGLDPRLGPVLGGGTGVTDNVLEDTVRALQDQLDLLSRRLGGRTRDL